ncbi:MAG: hypothetical protein QMC96_12475 [Methanomicrobiales archaeon]|nr:hypothetical protein [Methanomicrobiales archaeon]
MSYEIRRTVVNFPDHPAIVSEELFKAALRTRDLWRDNLDAGKGALGDHGRPYVSTGEAVNRTTVYPEEPGAMVYDVVGETIQHVIAEFGRRPGAKMPPHDAIAAWCRLQGLVPNEGETFDEMVLNIRRHIAVHGLTAFAPLQLAVDTIAPTVERAIERRIREGEKRAQQYRQGILDR